MSDSGNGASRSPVRLAGVQPRTHWTHDDRLLSFVPGAMMSFIIACGVALSGGTDKSPVIWIGVLVSWVPILAAKYVIRQFKPDFRERGGWIAIGVVVGLVVFTPLIVSTPCGLWGDKCKPAQQSHHVR